MDVLLAIFGIVAVITIIVSAVAYADRQRRAALFAKYDDAGVVEMIMAKKIWQGMISGQLIDSWGSPTAKDHKIYKSKIAETYKYNQTGKNRFSSRVMLEDGVVVGWKQNNA